MGNGKLVSGKFNITIGFVNHTPTTAVLQKWHKSFELASKVLHEATLGQAQLGKIRLRMNVSESGSASCRTNRSLLFVPGTTPSQYVNTTSLPSPPWYEI